MKINRKLNLVLEIEREEGKSIWAHSTPIAREVWETYFAELSKTFAAMFTPGLEYSIGAGPNVAALWLRKVSERAGTWEDIPAGAGVRTGLMGEIRRLTSVVLPGPQGWAPVLLEEAVTKNLVDDDEAALIDNAIVFFTCVSWMQRPRDIPEFMKIASQAWPLQTTSSTCTEFATSLPTSTPAASSGAPLTLQVPH